MHRIQDGYSGNRCTRYLKNMQQSGKNAVYGWKLYVTHPVFNAGIALACVYMTVLGFDNITYGYCLSLCISESILGALVGVAAIIGILGSLSFPVLRKRLGLNKTGLFGFSSLIAMITLCVVSIWLDGSPFDPYYFQPSVDPAYVTESTIHNSTLNLNSTQSISFYNSTNGHLTIIDDSIHDNTVCYVSSFLSVSVLLTGIILARFGLWISDLTITQILQVTLSMFRLVGMFFSSINYN